MKLTGFFRAKGPSAQRLSPEIAEKVYSKRSMSSFVGVTLAYSLFYVCRMSLNVVKQPLIDSGVFSATQLGAIGSVMLLVYAVGKFVNGFISDYCNIRRFMAVGLAVSVIANLVLGLSGCTPAIATGGSTALFLLFSLMWGINGWVQSMGAPSGVVNLSRWISKSRRATFYSVFSSSPYIGEFLSFVLLGLVVESCGWENGFLFASAIGAVGVVLTLVLVHDSPESEGLPPVGEMFGEESIEAGHKSVKESQSKVFRHPGIWLVALSTAFVYMAKYGISNWGVLFLQKTGGFSLPQATQIIAFSTVPGVLGTLAAGWLSDKVFKGNRAKPALFSGVLASVFLALFLYAGGGYLANIIYVALFNMFISILFCIVAGFMVLDIVPRHAAGAASGIIGISSYVAAGMQEVLSGLLLDSTKVVGEMGVNYDFSVASVFWLLSCVLAFVLPVTMWKKMKEWLNEGL